MKKNLLKIGLVSACLAFTMASCGSNNDTEGNADSTMMETEDFGTDTMSTDTSGMGTMPDGGAGGVGTGSGTNDQGTGTGMGNEAGTNGTGAGGTGTGTGGTGTGTTPTPAP